MIENGISFFWKSNAHVNNKIHLLFGALLIIATHFVFLPDALEHRKRYLKVELSWTGLTRHLRSQGSGINEIYDYIPTLQMLLTKLGQDWFRLIDFRCS